MTITWEREAAAAWYAFNGQDQLIGTAIRGQALSWSAYANNQVPMHFNTLDAAQRYVEGQVRAKATT